MLAPKQIETGLFENMPASDYHGIDAVSRTLLTYVKKSPAHARYFLDNPTEPTKAMDLGSALHTRILEPEKFSSEVMISKTHPRDRKPNQVGKVIVAEADLKIIDAIEEAFKRKELIFEDGTAINAYDLVTQSKIEQSAFWDDPVTGLRCKARMDLEWRGKIIDFKTTSDIAMWQRGARWNDLPMQAAWYVSAASMAGSEFHSDFYFLVVETSAPHGIKLFKASDRFIDQGVEQNRINLTVLKECLDKDIWPDYSGVCEELE